MKHIIEQSDIEGGLFLYSKDKGYLMVFESDTSDVYYLAILATGKFIHFNTKGEIEIYINSSSIKPVVNKVKITDVI